MSNELMSAFVFKQKKIINKFKDIYLLIIQGWLIDLT